MDATSATLRQRVQDRFPEAVIQTEAFRGDECAIVKREASHDVLAWLRDDADMAFNFLMDVHVVDYLTYPEPKATRFEVVYNLYSLSKNHRLRIKVPVNLGQTVKTVSDLWESADWGEREAWEMFGVVFDGHPNLKRLLTHKDFVGHPLRKDYPTKRGQRLSESDTLMDEMEKRLRFKGLK